MKQSSAEYKSPLVQAIEKRERKSTLFRVNDFLGLPGPEIHGVKIRVATKAEENTAVVGAHAFAKEIAGTTDAKNDQDILIDAKNCFILHTVCLDVGFDGPAFLGPKWMQENMSTDQVACLLNLYNEVRKAEGPAPKELSDDTIEAAIRVCLVGVADGEALPQWPLASWNREALSEAFVVAAIKLDVARREADQSHVIARKQREQIMRLEAALKDANVAIPEMPAEPDGETT